MRISSELVYCVTWNAQWGGPTACGRRLVGLRLVVKSRTGGPAQAGGLPHLRSYPLRMGLPNGRTILLKVALVTSAKETYNASRPVNNPSQPPAVCHPAPIPRSPPASRKKVIQRNRNTVHRQKLRRKVGIHMYSVKTPHIRRVTPTALAAGGLIQPAPAVHTRNAYHHQNRP